LFFFVFFAGAITIASAIPNSQPIARILARYVAAAVANSSSQSIRRRAFAGAMLVAIVVVCSFLQEPSY